MNYGSRIKRECILYVRRHDRVKATTDYDFNPIIEIRTDEGNVIVMPSSDNKVIVKSTVDK